jgi:pyrimidine oxygenase
VRLSDVISVEARAGGGGGDGSPPGSALMCVHNAGGRDLIMAAPDAAARSAWITAIIAVKTHGELVSKAWAALGGDCAAEVVQLMELAHDWEDLIFSDVQRDVLAHEPSLAFLGPRGRSSGALPAWAEGAAWVADSLPGRVGGQADITLDLKPDLDLAAVTTRIKLYASVATLTVPPAIAARMAVTIDSISGGRFGLNLVTGWQKAEYAQMGLWPGESHFHRRYDMLDEYATVLRALWDGGECNMQGEFYRMEHCKLSPRPSVPIKLICAGQSTEGMKFTAKHADYCFSLGKGVNTPQAFAPVAARMADFAAAAGRQVETCVLTMVIADETDEAARAKWEHYKAGADEEAIAWMGGQAAQDKRVGADTNVRQLADAVSAVNINMSTLIGSYDTVARMLDEMAAVPGCGGVMLTFDDFEQGVEAFGTRIQPLMQCRQHRNIAE